MNLFDMFNEKTTFEKNQAAIKKNKSDLVKVLKNKGFNQNEIAQVIGVIDEAERKIQYIKDSLIGSNIITEEEKDKNPQAILEAAEKQIDEIINNMKNEIPKKVQYIIDNRFISE